MILGILFNNEFKVMNDKRNYEWYDNTLPDNILVANLQVHSLLLGSFVLLSRMPR